MMLHRPRPRRRSAARRVAPALVLLGTLALTLTGCGSASERSAADGRVAVSAAFYPLQFAAEQVGGERVSVSVLTKPGGEPHDLELTPRDVVRMRQASLVLYEAHFQPAVDEAVGALDAADRLDVSSAAGLDLAAPADAHAGDQGSTHAGDPGTGTAGAPGPRDPHFWLDPVKYAAVGAAIAGRLAQVDPGHAQDYRARSADFTRRLTTLDREFATGLARCANTDLVTGHAAFGYLAARYGLHQESISGISPDAEPSAGDIRSVVDHIREHDVTTVYAETLASPALAETVGRETGATVAVLDPVEGITDASAGRDYFAVMRANLTTLEKGQDCS